MPKKVQETVITEKEFLLLLNDFSRDFFKLINLISKKSPHAWAKRYYSILSEKAHTLESFLDDHNARNNKRFSYFTELFASIKWFGYSASIQKHVLIRFLSYPLEISDELTSEFLHESQKTLEFLNNSILSFLKSMFKEAKRLKLTLPDEIPEEIATHDPHERQWLPHNIDDEDIIDQKHIVAEVATRFLNVADSLKKIKVIKGMGTEKIKSQTLYDFDETKTRHFESLIHNIQSKYDTYVKNTIIESKHAALPFLRGYASLSLHLFEMATILVHFYERHENDIRYEKTKEKISAVVPKEDLLNVLNGYTRYYGIKFFLEGEKYANQIIDNFIEMRKIQISTSKDFALHARPLSLIAKVALHYNTPLEIEIAGRSCPANSIMQMILLAGNNPKPRKITFQGEERVLKDIKDLFDTVLFEKKDVHDAPPHLSYLWQ